MNLRVCLNSNGLQAPAAGTQAYPHTEIGNYIETMKLMRNKEVNEIILHFRSRKNISSECNKLPFRLQHFRNWRLRWLRQHMGWIQQKTPLPVP